MKAADLYAQLEKDFVKPGMTDDWFDYMADIEEYICDNFKRRSIGVMCVMRCFSCTTRPFGIWDLVR